MRAAMRPGPPPTSCPTNPTTDIDATGIEAGINATNITSMGAADIDATGTNATRPHDRRRCGHPNCQRRGEPGCDRPRNVDAASPQHNQQYNQHQHKHQHTQHPCMPSIQPTPMTASPQPQPQRSHARRPGPRIISPPLGAPGPPISQKLHNLMEFS